MSRPAPFSVHPTDPKLRIYRRDNAVVFRRAADAFGGLSNMTGEFPVSVGGLTAWSSEALYQACRFPHKPEVQAVILGERSPMTAKMKSKRYRADSRPDWQTVRVAVMRWCLRAKLACNWSVFGALLLSTGERAIVEESTKDAFWGAKPQAADELVEENVLAGANVLIGENILGRLLMELREQLRANPAQLQQIKPPTIDSFLLVGKPVPMISADVHASS